MKSPKSEDEPRRRKVGTIGGTVRPLIATIKQALVTMPGINRLVPGGRKPVTHLYPYQKVELPLAYRGQHSIDWFKCIGCELCAKVCPNECNRELDLRSEEHTSELQSRSDLVCRLLLEKKKNK